MIYLAIPMIHHSTNCCQLSGTQTADNSWMDSKIEVYMVDYGALNMSQTNP